MSRIEWGFHCQDAGLTLPNTLLVAFEGPPIGDAVVCGPNRLLPKGHFCKSPRLVSVPTVPAPLSWYL